MCEMSQWSDIYTEMGDPDLYVLRLIHKKAYEFAISFCKNRIVLEIGCGSGYGSKYLSQVARKVISVDTDESAINYAKKHYISPNVVYKKLENPMSLPFKSGTFDVIVIFQVIEHIPSENVSKFLKEVKRVLKEGGVALFTTPNRKFRLLPFQKPWNKHHYIEYTPRQLQKLLGKNFKHVSILGLTGKKELVSFEKRRVKKAQVSMFYNSFPIRVIIKIMQKQPFGHIKFFVKEVIKSQFLIRHPVRSHIESIVKSYGLDGLYYTKTELNKTMDLMAICKK